MWIELKEGCEMPDYDEPVLWRDEHGNYFVRDIDKDDNDWWNGKEHPDALESYPRCTHYMHIVGPDEESNQDSLWDEVGDIINDTITTGYEGSIEGRNDIIPILKTRYTVSRK